MSWFSAQFRQRIIWASSLNAFPQPALKFLWIDLLVRSNPGNTHLILIKRE